MLSKTTRYAMLAMVALAREYDKATLSAARIADTEHIPQRVLEGILLKLKNLGYIASTRGKAGGYRLGRRPEDITLLDIVIAFEGSVSMLACICDYGHQDCEFCKEEAECPIRETFSGIYRHTLETLGSTTLASLAD